MKKNLAARNLLVLFLTLTFVFPSFVAAQMAATATRAKSPAMKAAENITAKQMSDYLYFIASDEMEGRDTPSRGLDTTAKFIGMNLSRWGFKPAGDNGTYYQKIALLRESSDAQNSSLNVGGEAFKYGEDFYRLTGSSQSRISAPIVYGGDGWFIKAQGIDALQNVDARGKIVVLHSADVVQRNLSGRRGTDWIDPLAYARQKGAVGIIMVASNNIQQDWEIVAKTPAVPRPFVEKFRTAEAPLPTIVVSQKVGDMLFADPSKAPYRITDEMLKNSSTVSALNTDKSVSFNAAIKSERVFTQNVVAIWEGSDPVLKTEMVAVGAHYDHVGMNPNAKGDDKIWNGADDDGSGTTAILSMAEALAKSAKRPKRSVLFVWHCGEEKGLWGSQYFTSFPTVALDKIVAQLNIDMIGRTKKVGDANVKNAELSGEKEVYVIGSKMMSTQLGALSEKVNNSFLKLNYNYRYDDPTDKNGFFFHSDHFNYAHKGIPIIFWFDGVHEDYHQPGDEPQKIDYNKMQMVTRTVFLTMWELADLKQRPKVDKQLPPELMRR